MFGKEKISMKTSIYCVYFPGPLKSISMNILSVVGKYKNNFQLLRFCYGTLLNNHLLSLGTIRHAHLQISKCTLPACVWGLDTCPPRFFEARSSTKIHRPMAENTRSTTFMATNAWSTIDQDANALATLAAGYVKQIVHYDPFVFREHQKVGESRLWNPLAPLDSSESHPRKKTSDAQNVYLKTSTIRACWQYFGHQNHILTIRTRTGSFEKTVENFGETRVLYCYAR